MTVSYENSYIEYVATASQTDFSIPFGYLSSTHIHVYNSDGGFSGAPEFVQGSDYSVVGGGSPKVVFGVGRTAGHRILIRRVTPLTQDTDYPEGGGRFPAASHEAALDKLTYLVQERNDAPYLGDIDFSNFMKVIANGTFDAKGLRITSGAAAVDGTDYATLNDVVSVASGGVTVQLAAGSLYSTTGDGQDTYETSWQDIDENDIIVFVEGQWQDPTSAYTVDNSGNPLSGSSIVFTENIASGAKIRAWAPSGSVVSSVSGVTIENGNIADGTIATGKLSPSTEGYFLRVVSGVWAGVALTASMVTDLATWIAANIRLNGLASPNGSVNFNGQKGVSVADGTASSDIATVGQLSARRRTLSATKNVTGGGDIRYVTMTFPWNVCLVTITATEGVNFTFAFNANRTWTETNSAFGTITCQRSSSGSNKIIDISLDPSGSQFPTTVDIIGIEGDA